MIKSLSARSRLLCAGLLWVSSLAQASAPIESTTIENGLDVIVIDAPKVPLATVVLTFKAGSMTETPDINGLTHVWEHMFFRGNKKLPNEVAFQKRTRQLGISTNAFTSIDQVSYYLTLPSVFIREGIELIADAIKTPLLKQDDLNAERVVVLDEFDRNASDPGFDYGRIMRNIVYGKEQHRRDPLGERPIIAAVTREQLLKIREQVFVPQNAALFIAGDVRKDDTIKLVKEFLNDWHTPKNWKPVAQPPLVANYKSPEVIVTHRDAQNVMLSLMFAGPKVQERPQDSYTADVFAFALNHRSSKFYKKFLESGLALAASLSYRQEAEGAQMAINGSALPEKAKAVMQGLIDEIELWKDPNYFTEDILVDVRHSLKIDYLRETDEPSEFVMNVSFWWAVTGLDYFNNYLANLAKVSRHDIAGFVKTYFVNQPYIKSMFMNSNDAKKIGYKDNAQDFLQKFNLKPTKN